MLKLLNTLAFCLFALASLAPAQSSIISWGYDANNQVSNTPLGTDFVAIAGGGNHSLGLKVDGSIESWGDDWFGQVTNTPLGNNYAQIAGGSSHSLVLTNVGSLESWGYDAYNQVSNTPLGTGFTQVACGLGHSAAIKADSSLVSWGWDSSGQVSSTPSGIGFEQVACGSYHSLAVKSDGSIVSWGDDSFGLVSNTPGGTNFVQVIGGYDHSVALRTDGSLIAWGDDTYGQVSNTPVGTDFVQVVAGIWHSMALRTDGSIASWGYDYYGEVTLTPPGANFMMLAEGGGHCLVLEGLDTDQDGLFDHDEDLNLNSILDPGETDPFDQDTDDDGLGDGEETLTLRADTRWLQAPNGNYYRLALANTWANARAAALAQGYDLTSIQDQAEADWLYSTFGNINDGFWIGLNDFYGVFEWSDGSPVNYTNWATGEPNMSFIAAYVGGPSTAEPGNWYGEFAGVTPRLAVWETPGPNPPQTALDPLAWDTDGDGLSDGQELGLDSIFWDGFGLVGISGTDSLVFAPDTDTLTTTDPLDLDSDEDGLADGLEDANADGATSLTETNPSESDSDGDGLTDGLELGLVVGTIDSDGNIFVPDADPLTTTNPLAMDTDSGGISDGVEDQTADGAVDTWETDPNSSADDDFAFYVTNLTPGGVVHFKVHNATPNMVIVPAFSLTGPGPTMTTLGINVALSMPIKVLPPTLSDASGAANWNGPPVPLAAQIGFDVYLQAVEVPVSSVQQPRASNPVLLPVGAN